MHFLLSSERSGSNLITRMIGAHPVIHAPAIKHLINPLARNLFRYGNLSDENRWFELLKDVEILLNSSFTEWEEKFDFERLKGLSQAGDVVALVNNIYKIEAKAHNKSEIFIKENKIYEIVDFLEYGFSKARYIYMVRDPRDMALSWKKNSAHAGSVACASYQWFYDQVNFMKMYWRLDKEGRSTLIRYEDLLGNPENVLKKVCNTLGVEFNDKMLEFYDTYEARNASSRETAWANLSKPILSNNSRKFEKELSEDEIKIIESKVYWEMKLFNYEPLIIKSHNDRISEEELENIRLCEIREMPSKVSKGIGSNINAKRSFYQRGIPYEN